MTSGVVWAVRRSSLTLATVVVAVAAQGAVLDMGRAVADPAGSGQADINLSATVASASARPSLGLTLAANRTTALPGDVVSYAATVSNAGATLTVNGQVTAANSRSATSTVGAVWDEIEYKDSDGKTWIPLGGFADSTPGYTFVVDPPVATGMALVATSLSTSGVQYGPSGGMVGSVLQPGATAAWSYRATLSLTASQVHALSTSGGVRDVVHFEVTPRSDSTGQPFTTRVPFAPKLAANGSVSGVKVTIAPPSGAPVSFDASNTPSLSTLAPGASISVTSIYNVPVPGEKDSAETDAEYLSRLSGLDGAGLAATADATATGAQAAPTARAQVIEVLPIGSVTNTGPAAVDAGSTATYQIEIANVGSAPATGLSVVDQISDGSSVAVTDPPTQLAPGASANLSASWAVPASQPEGSVTDTAAFTWKDANGNQYGPLSSSATTVVSEPVVPHTP